MALVVTLIALVAAGSGQMSSAVRAQGELATATAQAPRALPKTSAPDGSTSDRSVSAPAAAGPTYPGAPAYDSGWQSIAPDQTLTLIHNLGVNPSNYVVDLRFNALEQFGINQASYGGNQLMAPVPDGYVADDSVGAYWHSLTPYTIKVYRMPQDRNYASKIRVRIWVVLLEDWDSGWLDIAAGANVSPTFSIVGGVADNYLVYLEFKDTGIYLPPNTGYGIHQRYYGGFAQANNHQVGAYWRNLTDTSIVVHLRPDETAIGQVRVRIWNQPRPTYDSGWVGVSQGLYALINHAVGGNPDDYIVDLEFKTDASWGINQRCYGGCDLRANDGVYANTKEGAYWRNLTNTAIEVGRRSGDLFAEQVRVRIWNFWTPTRPDYVSGWKTSATGAAITLSPPLGGSADTYLLNLVSDSPTHHVNQLYYGIKIFGDSPPNGYSANDSAGLYWRNLSDTSVTVYRAGQDNESQTWHLSIWKMPKPDFDSGWTAVDTNTVHMFDHGLVGNREDFLVDVSFNDLDSGAGKNQRYVGGMVTSANKYYGAMWHSFTTAAGNTRILVYRYPDDVYADQVRVRIWRVNKPNYRSGYLAYSVGETKIMTHNLGASPERLLVDVTANQTSGDHKNFYGRVDMGTGNPFGGSYAENNRVGFMWYGLTSADIQVGRLSEDLTAQTINTRIWVVPTTTYLPMAKK
jgi:hypothetical protein